MFNYRTESFKNFSELLMKCKTAKIMTVCLKDPQDKTHTEDLFSDANVLALANY